MEMATSLAQPQGRAPAVPPGPCSRSRRNSILRPTRSSGTDWAGLVFMQALLTNHNTPRDVAGGYEKYRDHLSNSARCHRTKPIRTSAALTLATFMLVVVAATTAATAQTYTVLYNFGSKNGISTALIRTSSPKAAMAACTALPRINGLGAQGRCSRSRPRESSPCCISSTERTGKSPWRPDSGR